MKKQLILTLSILMLTTFAAFGQTSTQTNDSKVVSKDAAIIKLSQEVKAARELIKAQDGQILALQDQLTAEVSQSVSLLRSYEAAKSEISALKTGNEALRKAIEIHESTIALLQSENTKQRAKTKKWRGRAIKAIVVAVSVVLPKFL